MGLFDKKNLDKAKALAEKNKEKIASSVNKATDVIDQKTGGKHSDKLRKVDEAAQKYAGSATAGDGSTGAAPADDDAPAS